VSTGGEVGWEQAPDPDVRAHLESELDRLNRADPFAILRVSFEADDMAVRRAFLTVTKRYHPNRFARRHQDIRRLANEVFLRFNRAHAQIRTESSRQITLTKLGLVKTPTGYERKKSPTPAPKPEPHRIKRETDQIGSNKAAEGSGKVLLQKQRSPARITTQPVIEPPDGVPKPASSESSKPVVKPSVAPRSAPVGRTLPRAKPAPRTRRAHPTSQVVPEPVKDAPTAPVSTPVPEADVSDAERDAQFEAGVLALKRGDLGTALDTFKKIAGERPGERRYRLYLTYARGKKFEVERKDPEAEAEYRRALALDSSFEPARKSLEELKARQSPDGGDDKNKSGFLSRFFGKS
jgi:hypothetical protein